MQMDNEVKEEPYLEELIDKLTSTGMSEEDSVKLLAMFLEEQAHDYVKCMKIMKQQIKEEESKNRA